MQSAESTADQSFRFVYQRQRNPCNPGKTTPTEAGLVAGLAADALRKLNRSSVAHRTSDIPAENTDLEALCSALTGAGESGVLRRLSAAAEDPATHRTLLRDLACAARMLGDWWLQDRASFVDVTVGSGRILELIRQMDRPGAQPRRRRDIPVIFASAPGEQHTLGVRMAAEVFRLDGWDISLHVGLGQDELLHEVRRMSGGIVGLSIGGTHARNGLARAVDALRRECPDTRTVVCGSAVDAVRSQCPDMDVDGWASDIDDARLVFAALWDQGAEARAFRAC